MTKPSSAVARISPLFPVIQYPSHFGRFSSTTKLLWPSDLLFGCVTRTDPGNVCSLSLPRYEGYRYPFIYGYPSDQARSAASGIILASGVICGHLVLSRRLIATGVVARNSRRDLDSPTNRVSPILLIYVLRISLKS